MVYSPGIYDGKLYTFKRKKKGQWIYDRAKQGILPLVKPYETLFISEAKFDAYRELPGATIIYSDDIYKGRLLRFDAGIFHLKNNRLIHFWGERRKNKDFEFDSERNYHYLSI